MGHYALGMVSFAACGLVVIVLSQPAATPATGTAPGSPGSAGAPAAGATTVSPGASASPATAAREELDWRTLEAPYLTRHVQLTRPEDFSRAGEAYFDHEKPARWVVFQAIPRPADGKAPDTNYGMYIAQLTRDADGHVVGIEPPELMSGPGSYNTCGWFHPTESGVITWGSTVVAPTMTDAPGYSKDRRRYSWQFPPETEVVRDIVPRMLIEAVEEARERFATDWARDHPGKAPPDWHFVDPNRVLAEFRPGPLFSRPGYDAEGSFSADGRFYLYTHVDPTTNDPNLWIFDTKTKSQTPIVTARGYDGGPFFHPDFPNTPWICYRSDRRGDNNLQLFIGEIALGNDGDPSVPIGLAREIQVTDDEGIVNWCPFWHPTGGYLVFASSAVSHANYEVFAIKVDRTTVAPRPAAGAVDKGAAQADKPADASAAASPAVATPAREWPRVRVTSATGFDGLPAFSGDGKLMMWTSQRGPKLASEQRPSSQLWIAEVVGEPGWNATPGSPGPTGTPTVTPAQTKP